ncbi:MAG: hypothetical protein QNJ44_19775 [Rhodobacter sp.]|nr:hypothetical protein [Rhodobacter sp.]
MWQRAVSEAYDYADKHALRLSHVQDPTPLDIGGTGIVNRAMQITARGPILRLTFRPDAYGVYRLSRPVEVHRARLLAAMNNNLNSFGSEGTLLAFPMLVFLNSTRGNGDYIQMNALLGQPGLMTIRQLWPKLYAAIAQRSMSVLGWEVMVGFVMEFEERIFERNRTMHHDVVFFSRDDDEPETGSPQVTFNGDLFLPDSIVGFLTADELMLLMRHEAMHLARPNFFTVASAAEEVLQRRFPEMNIEDSTPILANFFGRDIPDQVLNCPLLMKYDDEMFTDYYVLFQLRNQPERIDAYEKMLKKLRDAFDPGDLSRMSYRVRQVELVRERIAALPSGGFDIARQNELVAAAIQNAIPSMLAKYSSGGTPNVNDILNAMETHPELRSDARMIRLVVEYYKTYADLDETPGHTRVGGTVLDCEMMGRMLSTADD